MFWQIKVDSTSYGIEVQKVDECSGELTTLDISAISDSQSSTEAAGQVDCSGTSTPSGHVLFKPNDNPDRHRMVESVVGAYVSPSKVAEITQTLNEHGERHKCALKLLSSLF